MPVKRQFSWEILKASVSMISLNLKTVIKSLCRPPFSRLNKPSSWDLHHRFLKPSNNFCWIPLDSLQSLYNKVMTRAAGGKENCQAASQFFTLVFLPMWIPLHASLLSYTLFTVTSSNLPRIFFSFLNCKPSVFQNPSLVWWYWHIMCHWWKWKTQG